MTRLVGLLSVLSLAVLASLQPSSVRAESTDIPPHREQDPLSATEDFANLYDALALTEVLEMMREEGLEYGKDLEAELFPGRGGAVWDKMVRSLYRLEAMETRVKQVFAERLDNVNLDPLLTFFGSEQGARIVEMELAARRAMMDEAVEEAAEDRAAVMRQEGDPRVDLLDRMIAANDLVDQNVVGGMNANYAFYTGLADGDASSIEATEDQILADVWSQETEIRADTLDWVYAFLTLAYQPLDDADLEAYIEISETNEGQVLNVALFEAFDAMYVDISRGLGRGAAQFMTGEDI